MGCGWSVERGMEQVGVEKSWVDAVMFREGGKGLYPGTLCQFRVESEVKENNAKPKKAAVSRTTVARSQRTSSSEKGLRGILGPVKTVKKDESSGRRLSSTVDCVGALSSNCRRLLLVLSRLPSNACKRFPTRALAREPGKLGMNNNLLSISEALRHQHHRSLSHH